VVENGAKNAIPEGFFRIICVQGENREIFSDESIEMSLKNAGTP